MRPSSAQKLPQVSHNIETVGRVSNTVQKGWFRGHYRGGEVIKRLIKPALLRSQVPPLVTGQAKPPALGPGNRRQKRDNNGDQEHTERRRAIHGGSFRPRHADWYRGNGAASGCEPPPRRDRPPPLPPLRSPAGPISRTLRRSATILPFYTWPYHNYPRGRYPLSYNP